MSNRGTDDSDPQQGSGSGGRGVAQRPFERSPFPPRQQQQQQQGQGSGSGGGRGWGHGQPQRGGGRSGGRSYYQGGGGGGYGDSPQYQGGQSSGGYRGRGRSPQSRGGWGSPPFQSYGGGRRGSPGRGGGGGGRGASPSSPGPSRQPTPELHQATEPNPEATASSSSQPSTSSSSRPQEVSGVTQQFQQLSFESATRRGRPIRQSEAKTLISFPRRPSMGYAGHKCIVKANHFLAEIEQKDLHQYDVTITPEVRHWTMNRAIMRELVATYFESYLGDRIPVYDGMKCLYTAGPMPFTSKEFSVTLHVNGEGRVLRRPKIYTVGIRLAGRASIQQLMEYLTGRQTEVPYDALQVIDVVLKETPVVRYTWVGRSFFSPELGRPQSLGDGIESWRGFHQSIRPAQMGLSLNVDISSTAFIEAMSVIDFLIQNLSLDVTRRLRDADRVKARNALKGLKVEVTHRAERRRKFRVYGITREPTRDLSFPLGDTGVMTTVVDYFFNTYEIALEYLHLPCLKVGSPDKLNYLPMELCRIVAKQRFTKKLNERQISNLIKMTCQRPHERMRSIVEMVDRNAYHQDPFCKEFGLSIDDNLIKVDARVLNPPKLKYHDTGKDRVCVPRFGQWNMANKKLLNGGRIRNWICINFTRSIDENGNHMFCRELARICNDYGMDFNPNPLLPHISARPENVEQILRERYHDAMEILEPDGRELDLLIVFLPDNNGSLYGDIKKLCETDLGLISQCCLSKHVLKMSWQYLSNLALKINVKTGGRNTVLVDALSMKIGGIGEEPTIIFGADVSHPAAGEDSASSISAVVASQDWPHITKYAGLVNAQSHREEIVQDLYKEWHDPHRGTVSGGMIKELLISFKKATNEKPRRIIFYRDGVSDAQFHQVLLFELDAIRKACASLEPNYQPRITFIVVQKRHHTRLFPYNHADNRTVDRSGNVLPGTVVDSHICHPFDFDFFLNSHVGIQGTSRPAHYYVLWDENNFSADDIQQLTNNLCYTYARCTRAVSIVPPVYYAHLAACRARFYMEQVSENGSSENRSARGGADGGQQALAADAGPQQQQQRRRQRPTRVQKPFKPLPPLKDNVKKVMFYC